MIVDVWYATCNYCGRRLGPYHSFSQAAESVTSLGWKIRPARDIICNLCAEDEE